MHHNAVFVIFAAAAASVAAQGQGKPEGLHLGQGKNQGKPEKAEGLQLIKPGALQREDFSEYCNQQDADRYHGKIHNFLCVAPIENEPKGKETQGQAEGKAPKGQPQPDFERESARESAREQARKKREYPSQSEERKEDPAANEEGEPRAGGYKKRDHTAMPSSSTCTTTLATVTVKPTISSLLPVASSSSTCTTSTSAPSATSKARVAPSPSSSSKSQSTVPATTKAPSITKAASSTSSDCDSTTTAPETAKSSSSAVPATTARAIRYLTLTAKSSTEAVPFTTKAASSSSSSGYVTLSSKASTEAVSTTARTTRYMTLSGKSSTEAVPTTTTATSPLAAPSLGSTGYIAKKLSSSSVEPAYETKTMAPHTTAAPEDVISTVYNTQTFTVTSCSGAEKQCSSHGQTFVTTKIVPLYTTLCPTSSAADIKPMMTYAPAKSSSSAADVKPMMTYAPAKSSSSAADVKPMMTYAPAKSSSSAADVKSTTSAASSLVVPTHSTMRPNTMTSAAPKSTSKAMPTLNLTSSAVPTIKPSATYSPLTKGSSNTTAAVYPTGPTAGATSVFPSNGPVPTYGSGADRAVLGLAVLAVPLLLL